jgi:hypothetical protein
MTYPVACTSLELKEIHMDKNLKSILVLLVLAYGIWAYTQKSLTPWKPALTTSTPVRRLPGQGIRRDWSNGQSIYTTNVGGIPVTRHEPQVLFPEETSGVEVLKPRTLTEAPITVILP